MIAIAEIHKNFIATAEILKKVVAMAEILKKNGRSVGRSRSNPISGKTGKAPLERNKTHGTGITETA